MSETKELPQDLPDFDGEPQDGEALDGVPVAAEEGAGKVSACDIEMVPANATQEAKNLVAFIEQAKMPALVVAAIDTTPEVIDGKEAYRTFQAAIGTPDAVIQLISWLTGNVMPALAEASQRALSETQQGH